MDLLISWTNPTVRRKPPPNIYDDIDTGSIYQEGWQNYCSEENADVLFTLILFIDKMHTDVLGKLTAKSSVWEYAIQEGTE